MNTTEQLPELFLERLETLYSKSEVAEILEAIAARRHTTLRVNTLKSTPEKLKKIFEDNDIAYESIPWNPLAFVIPSTPLLAMTEMPFYKEGLVYVQSLSSMIPPLVLNPQPGEKILDITAAPGSKTTQMAALMNNTGEIVANDVSHIRRLKMEANLKIQGATSVKVTKTAAQAFWSEYPEYFDKTLVDVPCSMEGRILSNDPKSYADWSMSRIKDLAEKQKWILRSAISATKAGGTIVYSTCTLAPEENEGVIDWILKKEKKAIEIEDVQIPQLTLEPGRVSWGEKNYNTEVSKTVRVRPSKLMEGFYVAKIKKVSSTVPRSMRREYFQ